MRQLFRKQYFLLVAYLLHIKKRTIENKRNANCEYNIAKQRVIVNLNWLSISNLWQTSWFHQKFLPFDIAALWTTMRRYVTSSSVGMNPNHLFAISGANFATMRMHSNCSGNGSTHAPPTPQGMKPFDVALVGFAVVAA